MHGDITRDSFAAGRGYSSVRQQQGRVLTDADHNEQRDIELADERRWRVDVAGPSGGPDDDLGFGVSTAGPAVTIGAGRYYVQGLHVENQADLELEDLPTDPGSYQFVLDAWERPVTAVEDPAIREVALGGPDTALRAQVVWRVVALPADEPVDDPAPHGLLEVRLRPEAATADPCEVPEQAGYRGLDNRTYRVQVHAGTYRPDERGAPEGTPAFTWSRDNASVLAAMLAEPPSAVVAVDRVGPGGTDGFERGGWVELGNDDLDLREEPGPLAEVDDLDGTTLTLLSEDPPASVWLEDGHPKVRRWDSPGAVALTSAPAWEDDDEGWIDLEHGIQVRFTGTHWRAGEHWVFAARTAILPGTSDRQLDWPVDEEGAPLAQPAHGPVHRRVCLAEVDLGDEGWDLVRDWRLPFVPLTEQLQVTARGGMDQVAPPGHWVPEPLRVGVSRGNRPVAGALVTFEAADGELSASAPDAGGAATGDVGSQAEVSTDDHGIATVHWRLGDRARSTRAPGDTSEPDRVQRVVARLTGPRPVDAHLPVHFTAQPVEPLLLVDAGGNAQLGRPGDTLPIALRARVSEHGTPAAHRHVRFTVLSRLLDGEPLDERTGGSLHASAEVVSTTPWEGGSRTVSAVVRTDGEGLAQVQWVLGTESRLSPQRVEAALLDDAGEETAQRTLFTAQLWDVDAPEVRPVEGFLLLGGGRPERLHPDTAVRSTQLQAVVLRVPSTAPLGWSDRERLAAVQVEVETYAPEGAAEGLRQVLRIHASVEVTEVEDGCELSIPLRGALGGGGGIITTDPRRRESFLVRVSYLPGVAGRGDQQTWHGAFVLTR